MGGKALKGLKVDQKAMLRVESIINSMTKDERRKPHLVDGSRRRRIAQGSGTSVQDVNQLLKQFFMMQKMIKKAAKMDLKKLEKGFLPLR
jgi:signal recognition particle subunit SRP54